LSIFSHDGGNTHTALRKIGKSFFLKELFMSAFRGMYGMFRADLPLFRFLVLRPLPIARFETREKLSHKLRGLVYIFD
jgi:hypothetical protein